MLRLLLSRPGVSRAGLSCWFVVLPRAGHLYCSMLLPDCEDERICLIGKASALLYLLCLLLFTEWT